MDARTAVALGGLGLVALAMLGGQQTKEEIEAAEGTLKPQLPPLETFIEQVGLGLQTVLSPSVARVSSGGRGSFAIENFEADATGAVTPFWDDVKLMPTDERIAYFEEVIGLEPREAMKAGLTPSSVDYYVRVTEEGFEWSKEGRQAEKGAAKEMERQAKASAEGFPDVASWLSARRQAETAREISAYQGLIEETYRQQADTGDTWAESAIHVATGAPVNVTQAGLGGLLGVLFPKTSSAAKILGGVSGLKGDVVGEDIVFREAAPAEVQTMREGAAYASPGTGPYG